MSLLLPALYATAVRTPLAAAGVCYTFSIYSPAIKHNLGYDQTQLQTVRTAQTSQAQEALLVNLDATSWSQVGSAILAGGYFAWVPGLLYDGLVQKHNKLAPRYTCAGADAARAKLPLRDADQSLCTGLLLAWASSSMCLGEPGVVRGCL